MRDFMTLIYRASAQGSHHVETGRVVGTDGKLFLRLF